MLNQYSDPLRYLSANLPTIADGPSSYGRYTGGLVGYFSYEVAHDLETVAKSAPSKAKEFPDFEFGLFLDGVVYDHLEHRAFYFHHGNDRSQEIKRLAEPGPVSTKLSFGKPTPNFKAEAFCEAVEKVKEYITSGDILQAVISKRYKIPFRGSLLPLYRVLRKINPSPYMYHLKFGNREIVGSSPEMLARKIGRRIESFPIAGTRPFAADPARNRRLASELLHDEKERAEHVMLVDLARNDIGRVSEYGTVNVPELMKVQSYSHVQHIVSRVVGQLQRGLTGFDLLRSVFPAGTVSGAPKVRAMQIIDELERTPRGPYAGAVGYFSTNGNADLAITIRTLLANQDHCYIQSGAGIVADSNPEKEWIETEQKLAALHTAIEQSKLGVES